MSRLKKIRKKGGKRPVQRTQARHTRAGLNAKLKNKQVKRQLPGTSDTLWKLNVTRAVQQLIGLMLAFVRLDPERVRRWLDHWF